MAFYTVWWQPPEITEPDYPQGHWVFTIQTDPDEVHPTGGTILAEGPVDVSLDWLAERIGEPVEAFRPDEGWHEIGIYSPHPEGDLPMVDRWIRSPLYVVPRTSPTPGYSDDEQEPPR